VTAHSESHHLPRFLSIYGDYKGGLELPKAKGVVSEQFSNKQQLVVHYSGFLIDNFRRYYYFLHPELWPESANTVISTLYLLLSQQARIPPELKLIFDRHSTNHNNDVQAFLEWLVRFKNITKRVEYNTTVANHGRSRLYY
jgi:hypothetical protein